MRNIVLWIPGDTKSGICILLIPTGLQHSICWFIVEFPHRTLNLCQNVLHTYYQLSCESGHRYVCGFYTNFTFIYQTKSEIFPTYEYLHTLIVIRAEVLKALSRHKTIYPSTQSRHLLTIFLTIFFTSLHHLSPMLILSNNFNFIFFKRSEEKITLMNFHLTADTRS